MIASVFREKISLNVRKDIVESLKKEDMKRIENVRERKNISYTIIIEELWVQLSLWLLIFVTPVITVSFYSSQSHCYAKTE